MQPHGLQTTRLLCPWGPPDKSARVGNYSFLQRIFPTKGSNPGLLPAPCLLHCRQIIYCLNHQGRLHQDHESQSERETHSVVSDSLRSHGLYSPRNSPGQNTGVGSLSLLPGIFPPQGSNPGFPHCRWIIYQLSHKGSPSGAMLLLLLSHFSRVRLCVTP